MDYDYIDPTYLDDSSADLSTEYANPSIYSSSSGNSSGLDAFSQIANIAGQWGTTIASVVSGNPVAATAGGVPIGAAGSYTVRPPLLSSANSGTLLLLAGVVVVVVILLSRE